MRACEARTRVQDTVHADNPAAKVLEARWRLALDNKDKSKACSSAQT